MSENIVPHPATKFRQTVESAHDLDAEQLVGLFIEALDNNYSREPLAQLVNRNKITKPFHDGGLHQFLGWCSQVILQAHPEEHDARDALEQDGHDGDQEVSDPEWLDDLSNSWVMQQTVDAMAALTERTEKVGSYGRNHKYWFFRPGWQVESALWDQAFEEHDPALTIALYLSGMFKTKPDKPSTPGTSKSSVTLSATDRVIVGSILEKYAEVLATPTRAYPQPLSKDDLLRSLIKVAGLSAFIEGGITWTDADFCEVVSGAPKWIASQLVDYWASVGFSEYDHDIDYQDDEVSELLKEQARYFSACIQKYAGEYDDLDPIEPVALSYIDDDTLWNLLRNIDNITESAGGRDCYEDAIRSICRARQKVFGGVFPFTFEDAEGFLGELSGQNSFWLSHVVNYGPENDQNPYDPFWVFPIDGRSGPGNASNIRTNPRALKRYEAYKDALNSIKGERLDELAGAWWAFFIASQAMAFRGLGLPAPHVAEIAEISSKLLPNEATERAIQFALELSRAVAKPLESRVIEALLGRLIAEHGSSERHESNVVELAIKSTVVEAFLAERIGTAWEKLEKQTKLDLVQAEQLFGMGYRELGAGRNDWGAIVALYARAVEAEVVSRLKPIIEAAEGIGACQISKPVTLGGCRFALKEIKDWLRKDPDASLQADHVEKIQTMHRFFADKMFIIESRNRAAHGDRERPIQATDLLKWREAMFHDGIFEVIVS